MGLLNWFFGDKKKTSESTKPHTTIRGAYPEGPRPPKPPSVGPSIPRSKTRRSDDYPYGGVAGSGLYDSSSDWSSSDSGSSSFSSGGDSGGSSGGGGD